MRWSRNKTCGIKRRHPAGRCNRFPLHNALDTRCRFARGRPRATRLASLSPEESRRKPALKFGPGLELKLASHSGIPAFHQTNPVLNQPNNGVASSHDWQGPGRGNSSESHGGWRTMPGSASPQSPGWFTKAVLASFPPMCFSSIKLYWTSSETRQ